MSLLLGVNVNGLLIDQAHGLTLDQVVFEQADWYSPDGSLAQSDSLWGRLSISYIPDGATNYLNLGLANSLGGSEVWAVQNLPLFGLSGGAATRTELVDINLSELGFDPGDDWTGVFYNLSADPAVQIALLGSAAIFSNVNPVTYLFGVSAESPDLGPFTDPGAPVGIKIDNAVTQGNPARDLKPVQEGCSQCSVGAFARSVDWLNREHDLGINRTAQQIFEDLLAKGVGKPVPGQKTSRDEWVGFKNEYAREKSGNRIVTKVWDSGNQVDAINGVEEFGGDFAAWLKSELINGEDVELAYYYPGNAHIVTVGEYYFKGDELFVKYRDDEFQGNDTKGDTGFKNAKIYKDASGKYHFGADKNIIYYAVSESVVPEPATAFLFGTGLAMAFLRQKKKKQQMR